MLKAASYGVLGFPTVAEFLDSLGPDASGCLVVDTTPPDRSGEDFLAALEGRGVHLPIIAIAASDDLESRANARRMKAVAFFRKPVDGPALIDAIRWALT